MEPFDCPACGEKNSSPFATTMKNNHKGLWCKFCGAWIKWLKQNNPWRDFVMPFGKYKGEKLIDILNSNPNYLEWLSTKELHGRVKQVIEECMEWWLAN